MKPFIPLMLLAAVAIGHAEEVYATFDVEALRHSELTLTATGVIETVHADVGDRVARGDILLNLENRDLELAVTLARADLERARVEHRFSQNSFERYQKVRDIIDDDEFERYQLASEKSAASLKAAEANLAYKEALLEKSILRAPYDGVISRRHKEAGDGVSGARIEPLLNLIDTSKVKLVVQFDEKYWRRVRPGSTFSYRVDGSGERYSGTIAKVYPTVDPQSRKATAELFAEGLLPGLFGEGTIEVE